VHRKNVLAVWGFGFRILGLLDKASTTWAMPPTLLLKFIFQIGSCMFAYSQSQNAILLPLPPS
jgi:hypothetical protein